MQNSTNLVGRVVNGITFLKCAKKARYPSQDKWLCRCFCGNEWEVWANDIRRGKTRSCGCLRSRITSQRNRECKTKDWTGKIYNGIELLERTQFKHGRNYLWKCRCHCGQEWIIRPSEIKSGRIKSCGCGGNFDPNRMDVYIYAFYTRQHDPFYIGVGTDDRIKQTNYPQRRIEFVGKWMREGKPAGIKLLEGLSYPRAFEAEKFLIETLSPRYYLYNVQHNEIARLVG